MQILAGIGVAILVLILIVCAGHAAEDIFPSAPPMLDHMPTEEELAAARERLKNKKWFWQR